MNFVNMTNNKEINDAIFLAEILIRPGSAMINELRNKNDFKFESGSGESIVDNILCSRRPIRVYTYSPKIPWSNAIGYFDGKAIHVNKRKLPRMTTIEIASNLIHEFAHYCGYSHGAGPTANYKTKEKCLYSVPYFLSENINKWI